MLCPFLAEINNIKFKIKSGNLLLIIYDYKKSQIFYKTNLDKFKKFSTFLFHSLLYFIIFLNIIVLIIITISYIVQKL